jgi:hypothetical protein
MVELIGMAQSLYRKEKQKSAEEMAVSTGSTISKVVVGPPNPDGTTPAPSPPPNGGTPAKTVNIVTAETVVSSTLSLPVYESIRQRLGRPLPEHLINSMLAGVPRAGALGAMYSTLPALRKLGDPKFADANDPNTQIAMATAQQEYFQKIISSGVLKDSATEMVSKAINSLSLEERAQISPDDQQAISQIVATQIGFYFVQDSILKVGVALNLPGLPAQISALAGAPKNPNYTFSNPGMQTKLKSDLTQIAIKGKNLQEDEADQRIGNALNEISAQGKYDNIEDLQAALKTAFLKQFDNDQQLADKLSEAAIKVASNISIPPPPDFSAQLIKEAALKTSLKEMFILRGMDADAAEADAEKIARNVQAHADSFKTEDDARNYLESELKNVLPKETAIVEGGGFDDKKLHTIAVRADFGLPPTDPLEMHGFSGSLSADPGENLAQLKTLLDKHLDKLGITDPALRQDVYVSIGIEKPREGSSAVGLINEYYKASFIEKKPFLNLDGSAAVDEYIRRTTEPALIFLQIAAGPMASMRLNPSVHRPGLDVPA